MTRCRQVSAIKLLAAPEPSCCPETRCVGFPRRPGGWLGVYKAQFCFDPSVRRS